MSAPNPNLPRKHFALVFAALLVTAAGNTALQSVLPVIGREIRIPDMAIAMIFSLSALFWTFSAPFWARQSDVRGRRKLMQLGVVAFGVSMLLCGGVILLGAHGLVAPMMTFVLFTLARTVFGLFGSATNPAAQAYVAARTSATERTAALAVLASAFGLGTILGPAIAPMFILPWVGLAGPMFVFALISLVVAVWLQTGLPDDKPTDGELEGRGAAASMPTIGGMPTGASAMAAEETMVSGRRDRMRLADPRIKPFMIFGFAAGSLQAATGQAIGFFIIDRAASEVGLHATQLISIAFMAGAGATLLAQWGIIRLLDLSPSQLMRWGTVIAAAGVLGIAFAPNFHAMVLAFALSSAGFGFARPGFTAGSSLAVERHEQGGVAGAVTAVNGACFILAPAVGIGLYELVPELPYWLGAAGLVALALYAWTNPLLRASSVEK
ncbi:MFS transporter [Sandaracinobacter sp. RS1-74]|uniref:MFS transporter n=1 Tax=Sandaracinobacteroides sayramensis TaxID=2913411 RepID=UPI001EDBB1BD|nr:MFS transporter [Sandaracinobacteroides sayramensis]